MQKRTILTPCTMPYILDFVRKLYDLMFELLHQEVAPDDVIAQTNRIHICRQIKITRTV